MEGRNMHPEQKELTAYLNKEIDDQARITEIKAHVETCEFCSDFCAGYRQLTEPSVDKSDIALPERLRGLAGRLLENALANSVIDLKPLVADRDKSFALYLAADGAKSKNGAIRNLATLCSEDPEVVLRVMRDPDQGGDYLQLLAEDECLAAHVMVRLPELDREFITDAEGRAELDLTDTGDLEQLKWQIKMPDAVFELEPLKYDPDKTEYAQEVTLETDRHDLIEIRFEGKTEGKQLSIKVVELDGHADYKPTKVAVTQQDGQIIQTIAPGQSIDFGPIDSNTTINIRLYQ